MHIKTAQFVVFLIVLGKWKVSAGLHIHFKKILRAQIMRAKCLKKACKARR